MNLEANNKSPKIGVIIVLYYPNIKEISRKLKLFPKNYQWILVDNTPKQDLNLTADNITYIPLYENMGIATAQNRGIEVLLKYKCTHIVFFDQDSNIESSYPQKIVDEFERIKLSYEQLFLLGPKIINKTNDKEYTSAIHKDIINDSNFIPKREIISSGSCCETQAIKQIGKLKDDLFIDYVDFEWCWRAKAKGFICGITNKIALEHKVGTKEIYLWNYIIIISSPFRYYYQNRNYLYLTKKRYVPMQWKIATGIKVLLRLIYFPLFINKGGKYWRNMLKGIKSGIKLWIHAQ